MSVKQIRSSPDQIKLLEWTLRKNQINNNVINFINNEHYGNYTDAIRKHMIASKNNQYLDMCNRIATLFPNQLHILEEFMKLVIKNFTINEINSIISLMKRFSTIRPSRKKLQKVFKTDHVTGRQKLMDYLQSESIIVRNNVMEATLDAINKRIGYFCGNIGKTPVFFCVKYMIASKRPLHPIEINCVIVTEKTIQTYFYNHRSRTFWRTHNTKYSMDADYNKRVLARIYGVGKLVE